jgi:pimeloyl-ACP methyl ester carboxylesterase
MTSGTSVKNAVAVSQRKKSTYTLNHANGPLVVDVWEPLTPTTNLPILLIHGWGGSGSYWKFTAQALSDQTKVIVPDLLGTGRSQPVGQAQNMFDQVASLSFILDQLQIEQVQVIGHSMGSAMGLLLAVKEPARVERLVLTSLCFFMTETEEQIFKAAMLMFKLAFGFRHTRLAALPIFSRMMASRYFYRIPKDSKLVEQGYQDYLTLDAATAVACANNATDPAIEQAGATIQVPTLLIACRQDQVMPVKNVDYTASVIPNCEVRWIEQCGHIPMVEKPKEYAAIVRNFLQTD